jgi:two-component system phosphate regulon sensor histidine kinase PhoR
VSTENLHKLAVLIRQERDTLLAKWRQVVGQLPVAHNLDVPTLNNHIPDLLEELADELEAYSDESMI